MFTIDDNYKTRVAIVSAPEEIEITYVHDILEDLVLFKIPAEIAALRLHQHTRGAPRKTIDRDVWDVYYFIIEGCQALPEAHHVMIQLLVKLGTDPNVRDDQGMPIEVEGCRVWRDLSGFIDTLESEVLDFSTVKDKVIEKKRKNVQRFFALLTQTPLKALHVLDNALRQLRHALEGFKDTWAPPGMSRTDYIDFQLPAAAEWILEAGVRIYNTITEDFEADSRINNTPGKGGALWSGKPGFSRERFDLWRRRFEHFSEDQTLKPETRDVARQACERMVEIQQAELHD